MFSMLTQFLNFGQQTIRASQVHWSRFRDYLVPRESFASNYSISLRKFDHIGTFLRPNPLGI
uniref:NADH-plastoquinone oxidoreductase subunit I n=1 Tax=Pedicularis cephalantha TaxID=1043521 RepID=UPI001EDD5B41|nr:NADH-plastoquinone oxidoreductase subunit I [Pedicularis cephalantha]UIX22129.1 NADH-plastoquinone oxidoreductase subunit I [Pedicularis cephalantha]